MPTKQKLAILLIKDKQIIISHFYLINIHIFYYPDSRLSGLFTEVPMSPDNRGSTVLSLYSITPKLHIKVMRLKETITH